MKPKFNFHAASKKNNNKSSQIKISEQIGNKTSEVGFIIEDHFESDQRDLKQFSEVNIDKFSDKNKLSLDIKLSQCETPKIINDSKNFPSNNSDQLVTEIKSSSSQLEQASTENNNETNLENELKIEINRKSDIEDKNKLSLDIKLSQCETLKIINDSKNFPSNNSDQLVTEIKSSSSQLEQASTENNYETNLENELKNEIKSKNIIPALLKNDNIKPENLSQQKESKSFPLKMKFNFKNAVNKNTLAKAVEKKLIINSVETCNQINSEISKLKSNDQKVIDSEIMEGQHGNKSFEVEQNDTTGNKFISLANKSEDLMETRQKKSPIENCVLLHEEVKLYLPAIVAFQSTMKSPTSTEISELMPNQMYSEINETKSNDLQVSSKIIERQNENISFEIQQNEITANTSISQAENQTNKSENITEKPQTRSPIGNCVLLHEEVKVDLPTIVPFQNARKSLVFNEITQLMHGETHKQGLIHAIKNATPAVNNYLIKKLIVRKSSINPIGIATGTGQLHFTVANRKLGEDINRKINEKGESEKIISPVEVEKEEAVMKSRQLNKEEITERKKNIEFDNFVNEIVDNPLFSDNSITNDSVSSCPLTVPTKRKCTQIQSKSIKRKIGSHIPESSNHGTDFHSNRMLIEVETKDCNDSVPPRKSTRLSEQVTKKSIDLSDNNIKALECTNFTNESPKKYNVTHESQQTSNVKKELLQFSNSINVTHGSPSRKSTRLSEQVTKKSIIESDNDIESTECTSVTNESTKIDNFIHETPQTTNVTNESSKNRKTIIVTHGSSSRKSRRLSAQITSKSIDESDKDIESNESINIIHESPKTSIVTNESSKNSKSINVTNVLPSRKNTRLSEQVTNKSIDESGNDIETSECTNVTNESSKNRKTINVTHGSTSRKSRRLSAHITNKSIDESDSDIETSECTSVTNESTKIDNFIHETPQTTNVTNERLPSRKSRRLSAHITTKSINDSDSDIETPECTSVTNESTKIDNFIHETPQTTNVANESSKNPKNINVTHESPSRKSARLSEQISNKSIDKSDNDIETIECSNVTDEPPKLLECQVTISELITPLSPSSATGKMKFNVKNAVNKFAAPAVTVTATPKLTTEVHIELSDICSSNNQLNAIVPFITNPTSSLFKSPEETHKQLCQSALSNVETSDNMSTRSISISEASSVRVKKRAEKSFVLKQHMTIREGVDERDLSNLTLIQLINSEPQLPPPKSRSQGKSSKRIRNSESNSELDNSSSQPKSTVKTKSKNFRIDLDGNIVIDEDDDETNMQISTEGMEEIIENAADLNSSYRSYMKRRLSGKRWSVEETNNFYKALLVVKTDFTRMTTILKGRTRADLQKKFKVEEKRNSKFIDEILVSPVVCDISNLVLDSHLTPQPKGKNQRNDAARRSLRCSSQSDSDADSVKPNKKRRFDPKSAKVDRNAITDLPDYLKLL